MDRRDEEERKGDGRILRCNERGRDKEKRRDTNCHGSNAKEDKWKEEEVREIERKNTKVFLLWRNIKEGIML